MYRGEPGTANENDWENTDDSEYIPGNESDENDSYNEEAGENLVNEPAPPPPVDLPPINPPTMVDSDRDINPEITKPVRYRNIKLRSVYRQFRSVRHVSSKRMNVRIRRVYQQLRDRQ